MDHPNELERFGLQASASLVIGPPPSAPPPAQGAVPQGPRPLGLARPSGSTAGEGACRRPGRVAVGGHDRQADGPPLPGPANDPGIEREFGPPGHRAARAGRPGRRPEAARAGIGSEPPGRARADADPERFGIGGLVGGRWAREGGWRHRWAGSGRCCSGDRVPGPGAIGFGGPSKMNPARNRPGIRPARPISGLRCPPRSRSPPPRLVATGTGRGSAPNRKGSTYRHAHFHAATTPPPFDQEGLGTDGSGPSVPRPSDRSHGPPSFRGRLHTEAVEHDGHPTKRFSNPGPGEIPGRSPARVECQTTTAGGDRAPDPGPRGRGLAPERSPFFENEDFPT
jgi:hypothetical protein